MTSFRDSQEALFRRMVRLAVRNSGLTKSEKLVTIALVNIWFHHRAKGEMHPGREKIARREQVSVKTVTRTMAKLREAGCLVVVSHPKGGRASTRYRLDPFRLMETCGVDFPKVASGNLAPFEAGNVPLSGGEMSRLGGDKMSHGLKVRTKVPFPDEQTPTLRLVGGRHA